MSERLVALLRGINVGGARAVSMVDLRAIFEAAGCTDVASYIQSGNLVFSHERLVVRKLEKLLEGHLTEATGFDIPVLVRSAAQLAAVVAHNPYPGVDPTRLVVVFLRDGAGARALRAVEAERFAPEEFMVRGSELYLHLPNGQARAKLPLALGALDPPNTARNWRTVSKLLELATH